jgi:hypothetical protein
MSDGNPLTTAQAAALMAQVRQHLAWANKLCERIHERGLAVDDPIRREAMGVRDGLQTLFMACHYASLDHGVGKDEAGEAGMDL